MRIRSWTAVAVAVLSFGALPAAAADLGEDSPYEDPRYGESYRQPAPPPPPPRYSEPQPYPDAYRPPVHRGEERERDYPPAYGNGHGRPYADERHPRFAERCVPRVFIAEQLRRQGWRTFEDFDDGDRFVIVRARDWNGAMFDLRLDRCSGRVLESRILQPRIVQPQPYDYAWRPRRVYRAY
jgi:hypothetical protein